MKNNEPKFCVGMLTVFTPKYLDRQAWINSIDPDHMQQNSAFDQCAFLDTLFPICI